ncbi:transglycosylase SLT domain-containing protein [Hoeflea sp.]|uniref:transglycosylase SLT domain-containing protein n=1 Tax=Hoeflea sp. TaxID=1940281 RepID=UPI00374A8DAF
MIRNLIQVLTLVALTASISDGRLITHAHASAGACEAEILKAARTHGVPPGILHSVGLTETGRKGSLHPYALNIEGRTVFANSRADALREFQQARSEGKRLIDLGCMQINHHYHSAEFSSVDAMLDPHANVDYAARFLARLHARHETWTMAVARYHAGPDNDPAQKRYICRVISNLVATGHGAWTAPARAFCN